MNSIRVLLADDHLLVRAGIRSLLAGLPGVVVVAEASNWREVLQLVPMHQPNVVLMDIMMPELNGLDATARIVAKHPDVRVVILSMNSSEEYVLQSLRAGAVGYVLKEANVAEFELAIRSVARGEKYLTPAVSKHLVAGLLQRGDRSAGSLERLTPRQREVLQLVAEGGTTKEIAMKLGLGVKTVETHRSQLMDALDIHDIASLTRYAIRVGLVARDV